MSVTREELAAQIDVITWPWLRPHLQREALFLVSPGLDLALVAAAVAGDDSAAVRGWLAEGRLRRPTAVEVAEWETVPERKFAMLIVQPFVLITETAVPSTL